MAWKHAKQRIASAVTVVVLSVGTVPAAAGPHYDASIDRAAAERIALRMGAMRGSIDMAAASGAVLDLTHTHSLDGNAPKMLPTLAPFSGPVFALFHEPIARPIPDRPIRVVYAGSMLVADAQNW